MAAITRAVYRRSRGKRETRAHDRALTRGLQLLGVCAGLFILALGIVALGTVVPWGRRLLQLVFGLLGVAVLIAFPLAAWIGWRAVGEEMSRKGDGNE